MQRVILCCVLMMHSYVMNACDICGCSVLSGSPGILPKFRSHLIGFRESVRQFSNIHPPSIINPEGFKSYNHYYTHELWGRWFPHDKIQVFGSLPYNQFRLEENGNTKSLSGFGDASVLVNYLLLNTGDSSNKIFKHVLTLGMGAKFNTGEFDPSEIAGFQLGSGTKDYQAYLSYTTRVNQWGALSEINLRRMGSNPNNYDFGDKLFYAQKVFYWLKLGRNSALPHLGYMYENSGIDKLNGKKQDHTGGYAHLMGIGADFYVANFNLGFNVYKPIYQNIGEGVLNENPRLQLNLIYIINKKPSCN